MRRTGFELEPRGLSLAGEGCLQPDAPKRIRLSIDGDAELWCFILHRRPDQDRLSWTSIGGFLGVRSSSWVNAWRPDAFRYYCFSFEAVVYLE